MRTILIFPEPGRHPSAYAPLVRAAGIRAVPEHVLGGPVDLFGPGPGSRVRLMALARPVRACAGNGCAAALIRTISATTASLSSAWALASLSPHPGRAGKACQPCPRGISSCDANSIFRAMGHAFSGSLR